MKINTKHNDNFIYGIVIIDIILFTYAAVSKILDFMNFQIQLGQSPLLTAFATEVSYGVPAIEFILILLLMSSRSRIIGLYGSLFVMVMFTAYIYIILHFSSFVPCSCGGILEKMTWTQHLGFNIAIVLVNMIAIALHSQNKFVFGFLFINLLSGVSVVAVLFVLSEDIVQHHNNFVRRLPEQFNKKQDIDLKYNSYYIAGSADDKIYLGNFTSPLVLTEIDTLLKTKKEILIKISNTNLPFRAVHIQVQQKYFFVSDGTVPCIFRGQTGKWNASQISIAKTYFFNPVFTDSVKVAYRTRKPNGESVLATANFETTNSPKLNPTLLQKQVDGIFDVDGNLMYDPYTRTLLYLYYYRNQFIITDSSLNLKQRGKTIDTISKAQIKVVYNTDRQEKRMAAPPVMVNKNAYIYKGLLFVNSALMGKYEDAKMWTQASLIDVYDVVKNSYLVSFYVYNIDGNKLNSYIIRDKTFYGIVGTHLVSYQLNDMVTNNYSTKIK